MSHHKLPKLAWRSQGHIQLQLKGPDKTQGEVTFFLGGGGRGRAERSNIIWSKAYSDCQKSAELSPGISDVSALGPRALKPLIGNGLQTKST